MAKLLNKCPVCGGKLNYSSLWQYEYIYTIKRNGELSKKARKVDVGHMECGFISCTDCDFSTDCDLDCLTNKKIRIWQEGEKYYYEEKES